LADQADVALVESKSNTGGFSPFDPFGWSASDDVADENDWADADDDDDDEFECDCPACRRERANAEAGVPYDHGSYETDDDSSNTRFAPPKAPEIDPNVEPPKPSTPRIDLPADPNFKRTRPKNPMGKKQKKNRR
jgi:hypothetical protein